MSRGRLLVRLAGCAALVAVAFAWAPAASTSAAGSGGALAPLARLAAALQWVRYDRALAAGREELALERARSALALDPTATAGWSTLAQHLAFELGAEARTTDPRERARWWELALATAEEGETLASRPQELALLSGLLCARVPELPPGERPFSWSEREAWEHAAAAFERAAALGQPLGAAAAAGARARGATAPLEGG